MIWTERTGANIKNKRLLTRVENKSYLQIDLTCNKYVFQQHDVQNIDPCTKQNFIRVWNNQYDMCVFFWLESDTSFMKYARLVNFGAKY